MSSKILHLSFAGPFFFIHDRKCKKWIFEYHRYFGVICLDKNFEPVEEPENMNFWEAVEQWIEQGRKTNDVNNMTWCQWEKPRLSKGMVYLGGGKYGLDSFKVTS